MTKPLFIEKIANTVYKEFAGKPGKFLLIVGTIGWTASAISQTIAIILNDKIPTVQKKFLIPQELADAAVNIAAFFALTRSFTKFGEKFVKSGRLATPKIREFLAKYKLDANIGQKDFNILKTPQLNELHKDFDKGFSKAYYNLADGVSFISSTIGSVISCNIITPILRNKFASHRQKAYLAEEKEKRDTMIPAPIVLPAQNRFGIEDYKKQASLNAPKVNTSGVMKV